MKRPTRSALLPPGPSSCAAGRRRAIALGVALGATALIGRAAEQAEPRVVRIVARRFRYEPAEVVLRAGEAVVIEVQSLDFMHGMNIPDLHLRFDLPPGQVTRFRLQPMQPGSIDFVCDNFCGEGHEEMHGRFIVRA
ncbi:MAG TPA: cupredoxin domain-containing protein [Burkholderiaceae bacterium]|nr:cupredoxin domain-containing protein [Burkholderiaceae bacterium]